MKNKDYTGQWIVFLFVALWCFHLIGCATKDEAVGGFPVEDNLRPNGWNDHYYKANYEEAETFPVEEEEPIEQVIIYEDQYKIEFIDEHGNVWLIDKIEQ